MAYWKGIFLMKIFVNIYMKLYIQTLIFYWILQLWIPIIVSISKSMLVNISPLQVNFHTRFKILTLKRLGDQFDPLWFFKKTSLKDRGWSLVFLLLLMLLLVTFFMKILLKFLNLFRRYENFLHQYCFHHFLGFFHTFFLQ